MLSQKMSKKDLMMFQMKRVNRGAGIKIERFKIEVPTMSYASNNNLISGSMKKLFLRASRYSLMQIHNLIIVGKNNERIVIPPIMLK